MRASIKLPWHEKVRWISTCRISSPHFTVLRTFHPSRLSPPTSSPLPPQQPWRSASCVRFNTTLTAPASSSSPSPQVSASSSPTSDLNTTLTAPASPSSPSPQESALSSPTSNHPAYVIFFTCKPCSNRSGPHRVTKQGFHKGTTLITCPSCKNRHVVSDHLRIFTDEGGDLVDIMQRHGEKLKIGQLGIRNGELVNEDEEEIEFWEDGTETPHMGQDTKGTH